MVDCSYCGRPGVAGHSFCGYCGRPFPPESAPAAPAAATPSGVRPIDWVPPSLVGRARHCPRCNTLISPVAVVCPACLAPVPISGGGAVAAAAPP